MNRTPPEPIQRILRQEVGFGCPVDGCRRPILTWHHFDPPWHEKEHHNPEGMIALCREHHDQADGGVFTKSQLHAMKRAGHSVDTVKTKFPWTSTQFLVRIGGCYSGGDTVPLALNGVPVIQVSKNSSGLLSLSFALYKEDGTLVAAMVDNMFQAEPDALHDLDIDTTPSHVKIWFKQRDIGLDLSFARLTPESLDKILEQDRQRTKQAEKRHEHLILENAADEEREFLRHAFARHQEHEGTPPFWLNEATDLPPHIIKGFTVGDLTGETIRHYANTEYADDEGKISFINFNNLQVFAGDRSLRVRNGVEIGNLSLTYSAAFNNRLGGYNF